MKRLSFLFSIMVMLVVSGLIASPAEAATINVLGSWVTGTTHAKEAGTDRALIFVAHAESASTINLSSVTYGGQAMTKVKDYSYNRSSGYAYAAAFILKETGVAAASSSTFSVTWGGTSPGSSAYSSVFLGNVDQTTATGATGNGGSGSNPVTTSALATSSGDMVILAATCGNGGSYTLNNSFIEGTDQQFPGGATGVTGRKSATGANETPSATYSSTINRQMIIGLVVKATGGTTPMLSVSPTTVSVAAAAGSTGTFNITSNVSWTVSDNQTWLTVSPTSGSNNATVTVTAQENTGSARTATVTVSATGVSSQTVTVTQAAGGTTPMLSVSPTSVSVAAAAGSTGTFNITSNTSWTVSDNQTWLTVSPTSGSNNAAVTVTAEQNTGSARSATVTVSGTGVASQTVTVTQAAAGAAAINMLGSWVTGTSHTKESGSNRLLVLIANAEENGTATLNSVTYGGQAMTKVIEKNVTSSSYSAYVAAFILNEAGIAAATSGTFSPTWSTTPDNASYASVFLSNADQTTSIGASASNSVTSGATITTSALATSNGDMVIDAVTCGNVGNYTLNNSFTKGYENDMSSSTGAGGHKSATGAAETPSATYSGTMNRQVIIGFVVKAGAGGGPTLSVSPTTVSVAAAAGSTGTFNITSNTSWTVSDNQTWLTVSPTSGSNNAAVTVTAQENTGDARTATVTVSATGVTSQTVTVTQAAGGTTPTLSVSPTSLSVAAAAGSTGTFNVLSNTSWTVSDDQTWLTENPTSGSNNGTVTVTAQENTGDSARTAMVTVSGTGVSSQTVTVTQSGSGGECEIPPMPSFSSLPSNAKFPNPFTFMDGTPVTTKEEWECRRLEIAALIQEFESGYKPDTPYSGTTASFSGSTLTVNVSDNGKTMSFTCSVSKPSGTGPFPVLLTVGGSSLGSISGVATVNIPQDTIAQQSGGSSRGKGKFYDMYGSSHSASAMMAWAWGANHVIDAIEKTAGTSNLDPTRIAVTGCSRNGKGALMCGAFDDRIDLTIPQESGSGGSASWRVSEYMKNDLGQDTQELCQIVTENVWFRANFNQFCGNEGKLPTDHHELIGLVAPRAIYIIDNNILWLGPQSSWNCANAAKQIWIALGVPDKFGYSGTNEHTHCSFPSSQSTELNAYVGKYLIGGGTGTTGIMRCDPGFTYDQARWVDWTTPALP